MPTKPKPSPNESDAAVIETDSEIQKILKKCVVRHSPTGIEFAPNTSYEEWAQAYEFYSGIGNSSLWWIGDSLRFAEAAFGEKYTQAIDLHGKEYSTLTTVVSVCERFSDPKRRRNSKRCGFWMHSEVAYIAPQEADHILDQVERGILNREEVRDIVARKKGLPTKSEREAAKAAKKVGTVKHLPPAANPSLPIIDIQTTTTPIESVNPPAPEAPAQPSSPPEPAPVTPQPTETPAPPAVTQGPKPTEIEPDQNLALQMCEANLNRFNESIKAVDWSLVLPLARKRWLRLLIDSDNLIDLLQAPMKQA